MADHIVRQRHRDTRRGELFLCAIEHRPSWRQGVSCDFNQVMTLRETARCRCEGALVVQSRNRRRCSLCSRSDLSPMFPADTVKLGAATTDSSSSVINLRGRPPSGPRCAIKAYLEKVDLLAVP